jgi:hypothetical protein
MATELTSGSVTRNRLVLISALAIFGLMAIAFAIWRMGGGHGSYLAAKVLFPYSMLIAGAFGSIGFISAVLALVQFPAYGVLVAYAPVRPRAASYLFAAHALSTVAALVTSNANFPAA